MSERNNRVLLVGHLGADPEIRITATGKKVARFDVATNQTFQNSQGELINDTQWHRLVAWGKLADKAEEDLRKGVEVSIEGKLVYRNYVDKDGVKKYVTEVNVNELAVLKDKSKSEV